MRKIISIITAIILLFSLEGEVKSQASLKYKIEIDILSRSLYLFENDKLVKKYPVAVGKPSTQTPVGEYKVINKLVNPYYSKKKIAGGSPENPLGSRWIGFKPSYGIHGNNNPKSIGTFVSEGCIRMYDKDVKELYDKITLGVPVSIKYEPIKIERDMENKEPIIIVYPDVYYKTSNLLKLVDEKLKELSLIEKIDKAKLDTLKMLLNKEVVVFSDKWVYMVNGNYITNDVVYKDNIIYVNLDKVCNFFNIDIYNDESTETVVILNNSISTIESNGNKYISINLIEENIGGIHKINQNQQTVNLDINYLLFNNKFVKGSIIDIEGDTRISLESIKDIFSSEYDMLNEKSKIVIKNKELDYRIINDKYYVTLQDLLKNIKLKANVHTKDKYVEIFSDSYITYKNVAYNVIMKNNEYLIPRELLVRLLSDYEINAIDKCHCLAIIQNLIDESTEYYDINRLPNCYKIWKDYYNTKFFLNKKVCL